MSPLHVSNFGGGVVLQGAVGQRQITELLEADGYDIGTRGALVATSDVSDYLTLQDSAAVRGPWDRLYALLAAMPGFDQTKVLAIGQGTVNPTGEAYLLIAFARQGEASPFATGLAPINTAPDPEGIVATGYPWPGVWTVPNGGGTKEVNVSLFCLGAREGFAPKANAAFGLYAAVQDIGATAAVAFPIGDFNALGTGANGDGVVLSGGGLDVGSNAQQLFFRGVIAYNNHAWGWGFDSLDATNGDGPARVMFSNLGLPLKYGNDNIAASGNRKFTDSDAIVLGGAGEIIRGAIALFGKLFFGTNKGLHYIAGYGRDSFLSDGFTPVMKAFNIVGPYALIEGPDKLMYGVSDQGLWSFDGASLPVALFQKLVDFDGHSNGYWDLIWTDPTRTLASYPGRTNQDLVWTAVDWDRHEVLVGIPWCNAGEGSGFGQDTVLIKYNVLTGGFTRQVFSGVQYTAALYARREGQQREVRFLGTATAGKATVQRFGFQSVPSASPIMPAVLPTTEFGPYAAFGPDGRGSLKRLYLTLSWETAGALPIQFHVTTTVDEATSDDFLLTIAAVAPVGPAVNDLWLDTSLTNPNIGNSTAGAITPAFPAALLNQWSGTAWRMLPGLGSNGQRALVRLPLLPRNGTWISARFDCVAAAGRYQLEALGEKPSGGSAAE